MYQDLHVDNNLIFITVNLSMYLLMIPSSKPYKVSNVWAYVLEALAKPFLLANPSLAPR